MSPAVMLSALGAAFAMSQAYRTVATLMAVPVRAELGVSPDELGLFAGTFHLAFGLMQIPMGVALDLWGPRRTVGVGFIAPVAGALLSAWAPSFGWLLAGQFLIGVGCAPTFLGCLVFIGRRYPAARFTALSGVVLALGGLGMLLTGTPLAWVVERTSWRTGFVVLAFVSVLAWLVTVALVRDDDGHRHAERETLWQAMRGVGAIVKRSHIAGMLAFGAVTYASFMALRGLWLVLLTIAAMAAIGAASFWWLPWPASIARKRPGERSV